MATLCSPIDRMELGSQWLLYPFLGRISVLGLGSESVFRNVNKPIDSRLKSVTHSDSLYECIGSVEVCSTMTLQITGRCVITELQVVGIYDRNRIICSMIHI